MEPTIEPSARRGATAFIAYSPDFTTYGCTAEKALENWRNRVDFRGSPAGPSVRSVRVAPELHPEKIMQTTIEDVDDDRYPGLRGPIEGIIVNEPFLARGGWFELRADGVASATPIIIDGREVARLGDGANHLRGDGNRLFLTIVLNGRLEGVAGAVAAAADRAVQFEADWYGEPDDYVFKDGRRVGVLREWGLTTIRLTSPEHGRGSCHRALYPAQRA